MAGLREGDREIFDLLALTIKRRIEASNFLVEQNISRGFFLDFRQTRIIGVFKSGEGGRKISL